MDFYHNIYLSIEELNNQFQEHFSRYESKALEQIVIEKNTEERIGIFNKLNSKLTQLSDTLQKYDIAGSSNLYDNICSVYDTSVGNLNQIIYTYNESYKKIDKYKSSYFEIIHKIELVKQDQSKNKLNKEKFLELTESLNLLVSKSQVIGELLKYEVKNNNKIQEDCQEKYNELREKIKNNNNKKKGLIAGFDLNFSSYSCDLGNLFIKIGEEINNLHKRNDFKEKSTSNLKDIKENDDFNLEKITFPIEQFENIHKQAKLLSEQILIKEQVDREHIIFNDKNSYDIKSTCSELISKKRQENKDNSDLTITKNSTKEENYFLPTAEWNKKEVNKNDINLDFICLKKKISDDDLIPNIEVFWYKISKDEEISSELIDNLISTFLTNNKSTKLFIEFLIRTSEKNQYNRISNYNNLIHLANVLNSIVVNKKDESLDNYYSIVAIIYISERTFYYSKENKVFLCHILSKNKFYNSKAFWLELFNIEYTTNIQEHYLQIYPKLINACGSDVSFSKDGRLIAKNDLFRSKSDTNTAIARNSRASIRKIDSNIEEKLKQKDDGIFNSLRKVFFVEDKHLGNFKNNKKLEKVDKSKAKIHNLQSKNSIFQGFSFMNYNQIQDMDIKSVDETKSPENNKIIMENLSYILQNPNDNQNQIIQNANVEEASHILKTFISHFANFNFETKSAVEYVFEISEKINFNKDYLIFFVTLINTSSYTIKNKNSSLYRKDTFLINSLYQQRKIIDSQAFVLSLAKSYLNIKDFIQLRNLSSIMTKKINPSIYSLLLSKTLDLAYFKVIEKNSQYDYETDRNFMNKRLGLWGLIIDIKASKSKYNYKELKETAEYILNNVNLLTNSINARKLSIIEEDNCSQYSESSISVDSKITNQNLYENDFIPLESYSNLNFNLIYDSFLVIKMDVVRTPFKENTQSNRTSLNNILNCFVITQNDKSYCQGMNYIVSFIQFLAHYDEEESFYLFMALYENTSFHNIFDNDLDKLKHFFYAFDRLLTLYTPELNSCLFHNNIGSSYYCSSWFTTLFTNCYYTTDQRLSLVLLKIWDEFLIHGWYSIIKTSIILFITYEETILSLKNDNILDFLFNNIIKSGFFNNENYANFCEAWEKIYIPVNLLDNLENEFVLGGKIADALGK